MKSTEEKLNEIVSTVLVDEPMKNHTTFRVGGPCDYYVIPESENELISLLEFLNENENEYYILGNGSNLLVKDGGYRGTVIDMSKLKTIEKLGEDKLRVLSGASLKDIANFALDESLTGYEFASGIPGTLGGAVRMNAGAYGGEHKDVISRVRYLDKDGNIEEVEAEGCNFGYRNSLFKENGYVILSAVIDLKKGDRNEIKSKMDDLNKRRRDKQPLNYPSAGSTFKRPEGYFAGKLIQDSNLQGKTIGGAQVSKKHAGFVINTGDATAQDLLDLIQYIKDKVKEDSGVELEQEVVVIGE